MEELRTKICVDCKEEKDITLFYINKGYRISRCNKCRIIRDKSLGNRPEFAGITEKTCSECKTTKKINEFHRNHYSRDGYKSKCNICANAGKQVSRRRYMESYVEKYKQMGVEWKKVIIRNAKKRSKEQNVPFNLTLEDIEVPKFCPVLGIPIFISEKGMQLNSPTLDKIIPELGYVKSNVKVISWKANTLKNNETDPETFIKIARYLESHQKPLDTLDQHATFALSLPA